MDKLKLAASHHIESFNYLYTHGLQQICHFLVPIEVCAPKPEVLLPFNMMKIWIEDLQIGTPIQPTQGDNRLLPTHCRQMKRSYTAPLLATICRQIDESAKETIRMTLGEIPIVVRSDRCHLAHMSPEELVEHQEDCHEFGGYFIVNGNEKIIRMLIQ